MSNVPVALGNGTDDMGRSADLFYSGSADADADLSGRFATQAAAAAPAPQKAASAPVAAATTAPSAAQAAAAIDDALAGASNARFIGVPLTFKWSAGAAGKPQRSRLAAKALGKSKGEIDALKSSSLASHAPLERALKHNNLSTAEKFNVKAMYIQKAHNLSNEPVALQVANVNGRHVKSNAHQDGKWSTLVLFPGERVDYSHMNGGRGLLIAANNLDANGQINVNMSPSELMKYAESHPNHIDSAGKPTKHLVHLDLSGFATPGPIENQLAPLEKNPLGLLVYANAKKKINSIPGIEKAIGGRLPPLEAHDHAATDMLPDLEVQPDLFGQKGHFKALVSAADLRELVEHFGQENVSKAQPTSAHDHVIALTSASDSKAGAAEGGVVHAQFNYEIQHNGKAYGKSVE